MSRDLDLEISQQTLKAQNLSRALDCPGFRVWKHKQRYVRKRQKNVDVLDYKYIKVFKEFRIKCGITAA